MWKVCLNPTNILIFFHLLTCQCVRIHFVIVDINIIDIFYNLFLHNPYIYIADRLLTSILLTSLETHPISLAGHQPAFQLLPSCNWPVGHVVQLCLKVSMWCQSWTPQLGWSRRRPFSSWRPRVCHILTAQFICLASLFITIICVCHI